MNVSFELAGSMSPKVDKYYKPLRKPPSTLALKKYFRKSMNVNNSNRDTSIIMIDSSSASSVNSFDTKPIMNETPIIISDSEKSFNRKTPKQITYRDKSQNNSTPDRSKARLSKEKYTNICQWINEVNNAEDNVSSLSEISTITDGGENPRFKKPGTNVAASSTVLHPNAKRFDELFNKKDSNRCSSSNSSLQKLEIKDKENGNNLLIDDSFEAEEKKLENSFKNITLEDSFSATLDDSLTSRLKKKDSHSKGDCSEYENLLDDLYGNSWREKKAEILPLSEPQKRKNNKQIEVPLSESHKNKVSNLESRDKPNSNLLKILQKARFKKNLESPWTDRLKNVCDSESDSDSDSEDNSNLLKPVQLFNDTENKKHDANEKSKNKQLKTARVDKYSQNNKKACSFLTSLSGSIPVDKCDVSALIFRKNFKQHKDTLTSKLFNMFNEQVFDNAIPKDTEIEWSDRMVRTAGTCVCKKITRRTGAIERKVKLVLSNKVLDSADRLRDTLIHEMCHAATWIVNKVSDGHGSFWKAWAQRAMKTFPQLPPIKRCHNYVINTKYTYKCVGCGYSIGRHTKSLDVERKRCGYCYGKFEILINKTSKEGETKSVPATPKKITGFALFVKENYANYKTPDLKHGEVMKLLGTKFGQLKVNQS